MVRIGDYEEVDLSEVDQKRQLVCTIIKEMPVEMFNDFLIANEPLLNALNQNKVKTITCPSCKSENHTDAHHWNRIIGPSSDAIYSHTVCDGCGIHFDKRRQ